MCSCVDLYYNYKPTILYCRAYGEYIYIYIYIVYRIYVEYLNFSFNE